MSSQLLPFSAIQMIGTQRSGSNLLRLMLNQLPEIYAPHPPHILNLFYPLLANYGNLNHDNNFKTLINDVATYIELNPVPWENADFNRDKIFALCQRRTLLEIFIRINELQCVVKNKPIWCCKSLETVYFLDNFDKENFKPFVIYLVRDGRDVALSFKKIMIGEKHIYHLALKWKKEQELALQYLEKLPTGNYIVVKYEDLTAAPEKIAREICHKIGVEYNAAMLDYYTSSESHHTAEAGKMWENVEKPVMKNNTGKFLSEFTHVELQIFESVAGDTLDKLGYKRDVAENEQISITGEQLKQFDAENEALKKRAMQTASTNDIEKRKPQKEFLEKLKAKFKA